MIPMRHPGSLSLAFPIWIPSLILFAVYLYALGSRLRHHRHDIRSLSRTSWIILGLLLLLIPPAHRFLVVHWPGQTVLPPGPMNVLPFTSTISLTGVALVAVVAYAFGPAPGLIAGLIAGITWAFYTPLIVTDVLALSAWGYVFGALPRLRYRGDLFNYLRQPLFASLIASWITVMLLSLSRLVAIQVWDFLGLIDFMVVLWGNELPLWTLVGIGLGVGFQALALRPAWRIPRRIDRSSWYSRSLRVRFLVVMIPVVVASLIVSVLAVTHRSVKLARAQSLHDMHSSAVSAGERVREFYITGRNLIETLSEQPQLLSDDEQTRLATLEIGLRVVPYFQHLALVTGSDDEFAIVTDAVIDEVLASQTPMTLTPEELEALRVLQTHRTRTAETRLMELPVAYGYGVHGYSIVGRIRPSQTDESDRSDYYLVGRALFNAHPEIHGGLAVLANVGPGGTGFVVDDYNLIAAHADPEQIRTVWTVSESAPRLSTGREGDVAYETVTAEGEHVFVYVRQLDGLPQRVVVELPYVSVLRTAAQTSVPLFVVQVFFGSILLLTIPFLASRIIHPLDSLSQAAKRIAKGNLTGAVDIAGEDEVAQLGDAFEQMRVRLQARLNDLSLLLETAQKVSAILDLERGIVPILEAAREETSAVVARCVIVRENQRPQRVFSVGRDLHGYQRLDGPIAAALVRRKEPLVVENVGSAKHVVLPGHLRSLAAFPVRPQDRTVAVLWIGLETPHGLDEARVNFMSTLASQAAVLMENARLFNTAEGGRQRLAAILASTRDAILVVDAEGRILLSNPAAQRLLDIDTSAMGQPAHELGFPEPLLEALSNQTMTVRRMRRYQLSMPESLRPAVSQGDEDETFPPVEVPFDDGRTFYASLASIRGDEGVTVGVVVVMRDVTHFKELDELKSDFVATVSHDLRAPLTFMRGYTTMLSMVGDLNDRQRDYMQRILEGIEKMNSLIGDLLDLRRVEAGVGIRHESCRLGLILVEAVESMRDRANAKGVSLQLEPSDGSPSVMGDRTLLRQAISNLVDNAIKYTPSGGTVRVSLDTTEDEALVQVADTGIGIAPTDQVRLFEKFYRIKRRESGHVQGTGLGLALVKSIVERHHGHVWVESSVNKGSTFFLQLPLPAKRSETDESSASGRLEG